MKYWRATTAMAGVNICLAAVSAQAAEAEASKLLSLSLKELGDIEVTSVSKKSEKGSEAAAAIYVITQEDIQRSGMTTIPELLRMVPGLNVAQSGSHQWSVSSRGLSGQFADTLLVLIDGRSVYTPLFSGVYWDIQDTPLQDIERIEVIRGPGATLWGANAVNGVINIITKSAKDTQGTYASQTIGNLARSLTNLRHGVETAGGAHVRAYAKYDEYDGVETLVGADAADAWNKSQGGFRADWEEKNGHSFTLQGDIYQSGQSGVYNLLQPAATTVATNLREVASGGNMLGRWGFKQSETSEWSAQAYYDNTQRNQSIYKSNVHTMDLDFQHIWSPHDRHEVVWGGGYRLVHSEISGNSATALGVPYIGLLKPKHSDNLFSAFIQDEIDLSAKEVFLTLGSKFEHNAFTGFEYQPSARLSWLINEDQTLWGSVSRSVRTPNTGTMTNLRQIVAPFAAGVFYTQISNPNAKSTEMIAYELGYRIQPQSNISLDFATFYNNYGNMIIGVPGGATGYGGITIIPISPENIGKAHTWGGEVTAKWNPASYLELVSSYSLLQMKFKQVDPLGYNFRGKSPQQTINARATFHLPHNVEFTPAFYIVDELTAADPNTGAGINGYTRLDMRLAWKPMENLELSLVGQNLTDDRHQEFSGFLYQNSSQIPRSFYGNITWKF